MAKVGTNVRLGDHCEFDGINHVYCGDSVFFGSHALISATRANVYIGNHVMFGPNVSLITGNHRINIPGRYIDTIKNDEKDPKDDQDIIIEDDVWIGASCVILRGVTIARGSVIGAGSIVTKDTEPYAIYGGGVSRKVKDRFSQSELDKHKSMLN